VSRTPVRAALALLLEQGFIEARPAGGVRVAQRTSRLRLMAPAAASVDTVYAAIIADRAAGRLSPTFAEAELARYAAPKRLVTRALLRLNREGLVERRRGHGWTFTPMLDSREALADSYRFRMLIECGGLLEAGFRLDAEACARSRAAHRRFIETPERRRSAEDFFEMNAGFHEMLARFSGNRFIEQAVRQQNQLRRFEEYASFVGRPVNLLASCEEHLAILDALDGPEADRGWASALLHRHLSTASRF
jgi:DNA-binding GntR family transcriptional regulator